MTRILTVLLILGTTLAFASGTLERRTIYPFDPAHAPPPAGLTENRLATGDGETLVVWSARPAPGRPVILYFSGNAGNLSTRASRFAAFTRAGYGLVAAGYRGSSGSSGTPSEAALIADAEALAGAVPELSGAPGPVIYYGESLGAAVAVALAERHPPAAMVLESPFASIRRMSAAVYGTSLFAGLARSKWPSEARIVSFDAPLLIVHGALDSFVPPDQGRALFEAAASADKHFELVEGAGHVDVWQPSAQERLSAFLARF